MLQVQYVPVCSISCELHPFSYGCHGCCFLFEECAEAEETAELRY